MGTHYTRACAHDNRLVDSGPRRGAPSFNDAAFTFVQPKGVGRVVFEDLKK